MFIDILITLRHYFKLYKPNGPANCRCGGLGDPCFEMQKNVYIVAVRIVARLRIVLLDDTVLSLESLVHF